MITPSLRRPVKSHKINQSSHFLDLIKSCSTPRDSLADNDPWPPLGWGAWSAKTTGPELPAAVPRPACHESPDSGLGTGLSEWAARLARVGFRQGRRCRRSAGWRASGSRAQAEPSGECLLTTPTRSRRFDRNTPILEDIAMTSAVLLAALSVTGLGFGKGYASPQGGCPSPQGGVAAPCKTAPCPQAPCKTMPCAPTKCAPMACPQAPCKTPCAPSKCAPIACPQAPCKSPCAPAKCAPTAQCAPQSAPQSAAPVSAAQH